MLHINSVVFNFWVKFSYHECYSEFSLPLVGTVPSPQESRAFILKSKTGCTLKCWLLWGLMRKQETKQSIMSSTSAFWLPVPLQKGLAGLNSSVWGGSGRSGVTQGHSRSLILTESKVSCQSQLLLITNMWRLKRIFCMIL